MKFLPLFLILLIAKKLVSSVFINPVFDKKFGRFLDMEKSQGFEYLKPIGIFQLPEGNEDLMAKMIANIDLVASIDASHASYQNYTGGIYYEPECSHLPKKLTRNVLVIWTGKDDQTGEEFWVICDPKQPQNWGISFYEHSQKDIQNIREMPDRKGCMKLKKGINHCGIATQARTALGVGRLWHLTTEGRIAIPLGYSFVFMTPEDMWWAIREWQINVTQPKHEYGGPIFMYVDSTVQYDRDGNVIQEVPSDLFNMDEVMEKFKEVIKEGREKGEEKVFRMDEFGNKIYDVTDEDIEALIEQYKKKGLIKEVPESEEKKKKKTKTLLKHAEL